MALVNYATREINAKVVYYGPGLSGKTTNIQYVFKKVQMKNKGKLISLSTQGDRTLFFDFLPVELGSIKGFKTRFHLYTVPGQVFYNSTRKMVLKGADGVVFVADSQKMMMEENLQSFENLKTNLTDMGIKIENFPVVIQYNKRDVPNVAPIEEMDQYMNPTGLPYFEASALSGDGVLKTLTAIVKFILHDLKHEPSTHSVDLEDYEDKEEPKPAPVVETPAPLEPLPAQAAAPVMEEVPEPSQPFFMEAPIMGLDETPYESEAREDETPPAMLPELFGAIKGPSGAAEVFEAEEVYDAIEAPDGLGEAISDVPKATPTFDYVEQAELRPGDVSVFSEMTEDEEIEAEAPDGIDAFIADTAAPAFEKKIAETVVRPQDVALFAELAGESAPVELPEPEYHDEAISYDDVPVPAQCTVSSFTLPVRITTRDGVKEVVLNVKVEIELSGEGVDYLGKVEAMRPVPEAPSKPPNPAPEQLRPSPPVPERPVIKPVPMPAVRPAPREPRKLSVFQKLLGKT